MKKIIAILLTVILTITVISCSKAQMIIHEQTSDTDTAGLGSGADGVWESDDGSSNTESFETKIWVNPIYDEECYGIEEYREWVSNMIPIEYFTHLDELTEFFGENELRTFYTIRDYISNDRPYREYVYNFLKNPEDNNGGLYWKFITMHSPNEGRYGTEVNGAENVDLTNLDNWSSVEPRFLKDINKYAIALSCKVPNPYGVEYTGTEYLFFDVHLYYEPNGGELRSISWYPDYVLHMRQTIENYTTVSSALYEIEFEYSPYTDLSRSYGELSKFLNSDTIGEAVYELSEKLVYGEASE